MKELEKKLEDYRYHAHNQYDISLKLLENVRDFRRDVMDWLKGLSRAPRPMEEAPSYIGEEEASPNYEELKSLLGEEYVEEE